MASLAGKKVKWAEVICEIHGKKDSTRNWLPPHLKVAIPESRRPVNSGCPMCKKAKPL